MKFSESLLDWTSEQEPDERQLVGADGEAVLALTYDEQLEQDREKNSPRGGFIPTQGAIGKTAGLSYESEGGING